MRKSRIERSVLFRFVYHPICRPMVPLIAKTPITANQLSLVNIFFTLYGFFLFAQGRTIFGSVILQLSLILDSTDGNLARFKKETSSYGIYLERVWHNSISPFLFVGLGIHFYRTTHSLLSLVLGISITGAILLINQMAYIHQATFPVNTNKSEKKHKMVASNSFIEMLVRGIACTEYVFAYVLILDILGYLYLVLPFYGVFYVLLFTAKFFSLLRKPKNC
ncbi:MAG: CDP-alcohol phosphatidyltransferase family protein [Nanoarchaeota archaeon]|nr:CDP-alcohol phosphatidyltransferase family protein [Nanoarchaeota archaeon]